MLNKASKLGVAALHNPATGQFGNHFPSDDKLCKPAKSKSSLLEVERLKPESDRAMCKRVTISIKTIKFQGQFQS